MEDVEVILERAKALNADKKWDEVLKFLPESVLKTYKNSNLYLEKAEAFWHLKKFLNCEKVAKISLEILLSAKALNYLGLVSTYKKDYKLAENYFKKSIEINSEFTSPYYNLGNLYRQLGKYKLATTFFDKFLNLKPSSVNGYIALGRIYIRKEEYDIAKKNYLKALEIDPNNSLSHYNLALIYTLLKENSLAENHFKELIRLYPNYTYAYNGYGNLYKNMGKYKEAVDCYKKSIELDASYATPYYNLGLLYDEQNKIEEAKENFELYVLFTKDKESFTYKNALSKIDEINKKIDNSSYKRISEIIKKIKLLIKFEEDCITHYTSITTAQFLILKNSSFRLSEGTFLNDTSEGEELFKFLEVTTTNTKINNNQSEIFTKRPFIGSFVDATKNNDLTLWRMYGKEGLEEAKGCSLTMNIKEFKEEIKKLVNTGGEANLPNNLDAEFYKVIYRKDEKFCFSGSTSESNEILAKLMADLKTEYAKFFKKKNKAKNEELEIVELLNEIAYLFKSIEYLYENEIRLVINEAVGFDKKIDFKEENFLPSLYPNRVYIELISIAPLLKNITIGPKVERAEEWASTFHYFLSNKAFKPEIHISKLPFK
ncbi:tetratricopeptide repeat protein [Flavobacterium flavigenum]|uniref:tetratricopeptide repeat protein n=1 Tax=Flavobacterium flavigenum TaxID=3003258 RepID=UPI0024831222|nr:tetratricopeptide repeat protein [Flavobacterium flavigenum]